MAERSRSNCSQSVDKKLSDATRHTARVVLTKLAVAEKQFRPPNPTGLEREVGGQVRAAATYQLPVRAVGREQDARQQTH
eukprot:scaffold742_cov395-Prasinococcus_capsulatus_cf.AAC.17